MTLTPDQVLDRLAEGTWRLRSLPTSHSAGTHMVSYGEGRFAYFDLGKSGSASGVRLRDRAGARRWFRTWEEKGFEEDLLVPWDEQSNPKPEVIRAALERCDRVLSALEGGELVATVMETYALERSPHLGWLFFKVQEDGSHYRFAGDQMRAESELLTEILVRQPELEAMAPSAGLAGPLGEQRARLATLFEAHGPTPERMMLWSGEGSDPEGVMRFADGVYAVVGLDADGELREAETWPADAVRERLEEIDGRGSLVASRRLSPEALELVARLRDAEALAGWHREGTIHLRAGAYMRGGAESLSRETLLNRYDDREIPVAEAVTPHLHGEGFIAVRVEPLEDPAVVARSEVDPDSPNLRYLIPHVWARKAGKIRLFELAYGTALKLAVGATELARTEEREKSEPPSHGYERTPGRRVELDAGPARVRISYDPIESGHGVHGEYVHARFEGLPEGVKLDGEGKLDVRGGGHLELELEMPDRAEAMAIKQAVLDALP